MGAHTNICHQGALTKPLQNDKFYERNNSEKDSRISDETIYIALPRGQLYVFTNGKQDSIVKVVLG